MKTRLTHIRANVKSLQKSIEWYENVIGFIAEDLYPAENPVYASFEFGEGACFSIMVDEKPSLGRYNFVTDNVDALWEQLKDKVEVVEPIFDTPYGMRKFTIKDLDGNELGFCRQ